MSQNLLEPEFHDAFEAWRQTPSPQTNASLFKKVQPIVASATHTYGDSSPTLRSKAKLLTLQAFQSYDPTRGPLKSHLFSHLRRLQRVSAAEQQIVQLPEQVSLDRKHLDEVANELQDKLGRDPSDMEIADYSGLSLKRIGHIRRARLPVNTGGMISEDTQETFEPASRIPGQTTTADAWTDYIYHDLGDVDRVIVDWSLGRGGRKSLGTGEIAKRLGITAGAVSQRMARIQKLLDERHTLGVF